MRAYATHRFSFCVGLNIYESADSNQQWLGRGHDRGAAIRYSLPAGAGPVCAAAAERQLALLWLWCADLRALSADQPSADHTGDSSADRVAASGFARGAAGLDRDLGADRRYIRGAWPLCRLPLADEGRAEDLGQGRDVRAGPRRD